MKKSLTNQKVTLLDRGRVRIENLTNETIINRNFKGLGPRQFHDYDKEGEPYFNVELSGDVFDALDADEWDLWVSKNRSSDPQGEDKYGAQIFVDTEGRGVSKIWKVGEPRSDGRRPKVLINVHDLDVLGSLDDARFELAEVIVRPWTRKSGKHAGKKRMYLEQMIFTLMKPELSSTWGDTYDADEDEGEVGDEELPFN